MKPARMGQVRSRNKNGVTYIAARQIARSRILVCVLTLAHLAVSSAAADAPKTIELTENWRLASATDVQATGASLSLPDYQAASWHAIRRMPATVLEILQEDGVYPD